MSRKIAVGDLGEFWYGDYKEPFVQLEGGVPGYPEGVLLADDDGKLLCAYCGKTYKNLGNHVRMHGFNARQYKDEVGLLRGSALISEANRVDVAARALRQWATTPPSTRDKLRELNKDRRTRARSSKAGGDSTNTPELLNKTGTCYAQALAVARQIAQDGTLTQAKLDKRGIYWKRVRMYFGNIERLRRLVNGGWGDKMRRWTDAELLAALASLAQEIGRTPFASDLRRYGLPNVQTMVHRFGSYTKACRRAGLEPNLPRPLTTEVEARVLVAYAVTADATRVGEALDMSRDRVFTVLHKYGYPFGRGGNHHEARKAWAAEMARRLVLSDELSA